MRRHNMLMAMTIATVMMMGSVATAQVMAPATPIEAKRPVVQVALLLDNSGSMGGLINQARAQLWTFINEFVMSKKDGKPPMIQVALFTYGDPPPQMLTPLTDDLDLVSEKLFAVGISGGSEYCGEVIQAAVQTLSWSSNPEDLKVIFIAGNEAFTQGEIDYRVACKMAIAKGILVNTIHCGNEAAGIGGMWKDGAMLADGQFLNIDQNKQIVQIAAPQDEELSKLSQQINTTYVAYGVDGKDAKKRQMEQDANAVKISSGYVAQRAISKGSAQYSNTKWDLVDAVREGKTKVEDIKEALLPEEMRKLSTAERTAYVAKMGEERDTIRKRIAELTVAREAYVQAEREKLAVEAGAETLQSAMIRVIREQATEKHFTFEGR